MIHGEIIHGEMIQGEIIRGESRGVHKQSVGGVRGEQERWEGDIQIFYLLKNKKIKYGFL